MPPDPDDRDLRRIWELAAILADQIPLARPDWPDLAAKADELAALIHRQHAATATPNEEGGST